MNSLVKSRNTPRIPGPSPFINLKREKAGSSLKSIRKVTADGINT